MIAAVPVLTNSPDTNMSAHFGSAPFLAIINSETGHVDFIDRSSKVEHECAPIAVFNEKKVEAVLCAGIGRGAV
ncbi:MAG: dinitrogenase iron-molybdenum cofactor biosynthesis protein, partial [Spirochaetales bacterium]